jgi:hypothetical protein
MGFFATGLPAYLHALEHEREDAAEMSAATDTPSTPGINVNFPAPAKEQHHHHDEANCPICAAVHAPAIASGAVALLIDTGLWVRYVSMPAFDQRSQTLPTRISCRGPPHSQPGTPLS